MTCAQICHKCFPFCAIPICVITLLCQMGILDFFLINHTSKDIPRLYYGINSTMVTEGPHWAWYLWVVPDFIVVSLFITAFVKCHQHLKKVANGEEDKPGIGGELPFGYIAWGVYSLILSLKIGLIFWFTAQRLEAASAVGPNLLKTGVSLACVVYITLVMNHHDAGKDSGRETFINFLAHSVTMDVLDTSEILQVIFYQETHITLTFSLHKAVICIACINLFLPTILLFALSKSEFGKDEVWRKRLTVIHKILFVACINIPLLVLRVILWHVHQQTVSVFVIKNFLSLGIMVRVIHIQVTSAVAESNIAKAALVEEVPLQDMSPAKPSNSDIKTASC